MIVDKIFQITDTFSLYYDDTVVNEGYSVSLEEYRCKTFFTKEPETIEWINSFNEGEVFYDIGANVGQYSIYAGIQTPSLKVFAIEPFLDNFQRIQDNVKLNKTNNVIPLLLGISDHCSIEKIYIKDQRKSASGNQIGQSIDEHGNAFDPVDIQFTLSMDLDQMTVLFHLPKPNHIKIDVDGIEDKIIFGMPKILRNNELKSVLIEINSEGRKKEIVLESFKVAGFTQNNPFNQDPAHSRHRRKGTHSEVAENVIFTRF